MLLVPSARLSRRLASVASASTLLATLPCSRGACCGVIAASRRFDDSDLLEAVSELASLYATRPLPFRFAASPAHQVRPYFLWASSAATAVRYAREHPSVSGTPIGFQLVMWQWLKQRAKPKDR